MAYEVPVTDAFQAGGLGQQYKTRLGGSRLAQGARESLLRKKREKRAKGKKGISKGHDAFVAVVEEEEEDAALLEKWSFPRGSMSSLQFVGEGNFGKVYKAEAEGIIKGQARTTVAVKTLQGDSPELAAEFHAEARIMMNIDGPHNIVRLLGICVEKPPLLMIMEYMARGDLKGVLMESRPEEGKPSPLSHRILGQMSVDIAEGMMYLAKRKIVHRDLAARNCLVADDYTVKVGDFGLTRDVYHREYYRMVGCSPLPIRWMSPEAIGDGVFTSSSDVWSFGITLWEIATLAQTPYGRMENVDVVERVVEEDYRMPKPPGCPDGFYDMMMECWEEEAEDRVTFTELHDSLKALVPKLPQEPIVLGAKAKAAAGADYLDAGAYDLPVDSIFVAEDKAAEGGAYDSAAAEALYDEATGEGCVEYDLAARVSYPTLRRDARMSLRKKKSDGAGDGPYALAKPPPSVAATSGSGAVASKFTRLYELASQPELPEDQVLALYAKPLPKGQRRTSSSGLSLEDAAAHAQEWLSGVLGRPLHGEDMADTLHTGEVLCEAMDKLKPGAIGTWHKGSKIAFKHMENIGSFLRVCVSLGLPSADLFVTNDLYEDANIKQVICTILALEKVLSSS